jgi:hypothetical protein
MAAGAVVSFRRRYMGVTAYTGLPGSGKTYSLVDVGVQAVKRGRTVWCNADDTGKAPFFFQADGFFATFDDFMQVPPNAVILWDELPIWVNSRKWQEFPDGLLYRLSQIRKDGLELHYSCMDMRMVDNNVRRITFREWQCHALGLGIHRRVLWGPPEYRRKDDKLARRELYRIKPEVAEAYNSWGKVAAPLATATSTEPPSPAGVPAPAGRPVNRIADLRRAR